MLAITYIKKKYTIIKYIHVNKSWNLKYGKLHISLRNSCTLIDNRYNVKLKLIIII